MTANFQATAGELSLVTRIFAQSDPKKTGFLSGDVAVRVFGGAKLPPTVLGEIWNIADDENRGSLNTKGVAVAIRLIGWAQKGEKVTPALVNQAGPLPTIEGISGVSTHNTGLSIPRSPPPVSGLPPFTAQDKAKFQNMFLKSGPTNGLLSGEQARDILLKSKLPNDKLGQIWNLADTRNRGSLDAVDFAIAMYFVQGAMSGQITTIPPVLSPALYQQASGFPATQSAIRAQTTGTSGSFSPINSTFSQRSVQSQYTGQNQLPLQPDVTGGFPARRGPPVPPHLPARPSPSQVGSGAFGRSSVSTHWDITPAEKANSDKFFDNLDSQRRGYIEGDVTVPFMLESQLGEEDLARVWDLADINNDGRLTRDGFAVALYLIKKKLAGIDVPITLPPTLVPPSMRKADGASAFSPAPAPSPPPSAREPAIDLLWDDTPAQPVSTAAPSRAFSIPLQPTGPQTSAAGSSFNSPSQPQPAAQDPFRSSPFGSGSAKDLLSDDDDVQAAPPRLHDQSAEIGNTQNQLNSTNRSLETAKTNRASVEQTLANQAAQLSALQTQLSSAKAAYETETKLLSTLRDRLNTQTAEIQKTRETLISAESDLSAVRVEKAEVEGAFLRDKEEARELHRRMLEVSQQADTLKAEMEKSKKEAKQQKGLLAIAKKQLSTKEADRAKAEKELQEANAELAAVNKEKIETEMQIAELDAAPIIAPAPERALSSDSLAFAASHALPVTPDPTSPAVSTKSNNPFDRLALSSGHSTPRSESPFMPFAATSLPSPPTGAPSSNVAADSGDHFGFSQAFESLDVPPELAVLDATKAPIEEPEASTPKLPAAEVPNGLPTSEAPISPGSASETEVFTTPPTTSAGLLESANGKQSTLEVTSSKFPPLDEPVTVAPTPESDVPTEPSRKSGDHTDLRAQLKEIDLEESDSDSEEDEVPLALLAKSRTLSESPSAASAPSPAVTNGTAVPPASSFDDIFGVGSSPSPAATTIPTTEADAFGVPIKKSPSPFDTSDVFSTSSTDKSQNRAVSGVNVFDEAMGKLPSTGPSPTQFSFDSAFDDNFDFGASREPKFPPAPKTVNGSATSPLPAPTKDDGFDSLFATSTVVTANGNHTSAPAPDRVPTPTPVATLATTSSAATVEPSGPSFDDVFSGFNPSPPLNLDTTLTATPAKISESPKPLPTSTSPPGSLSSLQGGPPVSPPLRERTPPPRISSPKPRPSTSSSSKEGHELKPPTTRHSKLSIRLPFGKKKKHEAVVPPPSQFLTPPTEEPRSTSPASDDDVESVKQLTAMGFSRTQAVTALEQYGYDVPRALNSLLGQ
ncbi:uncharacterized protein BT62DRAFT_879116 [Guyanagaster necrorhizus]|uniref:Uncharacterized protein n=1 Tax=Guyanagaster necrorhizus TaxID=856835 RepID=A0A9P7W578_9AGAR|nr:uncharacterized protein BT62DRAFT_879116 [Guyanagaster necrorhizus MCA 3950]KAG7452893.1 hypothetical protein BT62DRAFT_879116 [Guyanagaster necrorhizus MCA 3950]